MICREGAPSSQNIILDNELKPIKGMEFDTKEEAWDFWKDYGGRIGFGVRNLLRIRAKKMVP